jgi:pyruvate,orthophosphate dikinase
VVGTLAVRVDGTVGLARGSSRELAASVGVLTTRGGLVSHAAVVARGWGIPAVVGADRLVIDGTALRTADGRVVRAGELITIDGSTGGIWLGRVEATTAVEADIDQHLPHLRRLEDWARTPEGATA